MEKREVKIKADAVVPFHNQVDYCIGTGRMGLALQKEYQAQLKLVQDAIGFQHIRGHGLFTDDMAIYQETEKDGERIVEYNFTYLDMVMDSYIEVGLRPFLELGFMPQKMARGTQTVFYWKGNTTPPKDYEDWKKMIQALLRHLIDRYGEEDVLTWPIEGWNEPNLPGFWEKADMQEYFKLFKNSFEAIKEVNPKFRVGGPAVCGGSDEIWIKAFMEFCHDNKIPVDFVTRHHYTTELPDDVGHYGYAELMKAEDGFANLHTTRDIIDSFPEYKGMEIHITEFNTSYIPNCPIHDTNQNAAFIAQQLSRLGDDNESYSYWTFGDIFEERGVPFTPFHGGFGLVANGCIPKPTFWTFAFFKKLKEKQGVCVYRDDNSVVMKLADGEYRGIVWNQTRNRTGNTISFQYDFEADKKQYCLLTKRVDEETTNPLKVWHDLGEPANPSKEQVALLQSAANPFVATKTMKAVNDKVSMELIMDEHAVVYFELKAVTTTSDRGYSYERVMQQKAVNPLTKLDYPDPDVIRVEDTYYMVSTTMHFMPGCEILRSYDLIHWEHAAYVYDTLDGTSGQKLEGEQNIYGKGMWAASLRYHKGTFYICFVANDTHKTYLFTSKTIEGPWEKKTIEGFFHDCSLLFDDDDKVYIVSGNRDIYLVELKEDLTGPKEGGLNRLIVSDKDNPSLGYEGSHLYKINGKYYLFLIHSLPDRWRRVEACFCAEGLDKEFKGGDIFNDDRDYCGQGVAQGGIVDTPEGKWYSIMFQDSGAVGRMPVLVPVSWENDYPVFGVEGKVPEEIQTTNLKPGYEYAPLVCSDDFKGASFASEEDKKRAYGSFGLKSAWQFNHEPELSCVEVKEDKGELWITTDKICTEITQAKNILTQRMSFPSCAAEVALNFSEMKDGDIAGLCAFQGNYAFVAVKKKDGKLYAVMGNKEDGDAVEEVEINSDRMRLKIEADFTDMKDEAKFYFADRYWYTKIGKNHKMQFKLDHFTGCRFGLFIYSTKETGGKVGFSNFVYKVR